MAKPSKFAHVVYSTRRYEEMIDWYQRVFEAKVVYQNPALAFLTYDDEHHRFAFANLLAFSPDTAEVKTRGLYLRKSGRSARYLRSPQAHGHHAVLADSSRHDAVVLLQGPGRQSNGVSGGYLFCRRGQRIYADRGFCRESGWR